MKQSEIERLFHEEVRLKKKIGSNIYSKTGSRGYTGTIRSPHDLLKGKAKKQYEGNSKVMTTNMYDKILPRSEFDKLETNIQRNMYSYWYITHGINAIKKEMGIGNATVYTYLDKLGIERKGLKGNKRPRKAVPKVKPIKSEPKQFVADFEPMPAPPVNNSGLSVNYSGSYTAEEIQKIMQKLDLLLQDEKSTFNIKIELNQQ